MIFVFNIFGKNPTPKPKIECDFAFSPDKIAAFHGSTATIFVCSSRRFNVSPTPVIVPPVPTPATK